MCFNPAAQRRLALLPDMVACLHALDDWMSARDLSAALPEFGSVAAFSALLREMRSSGLVEEEGRTREWPWRTWSPEAAFFHFGTRGGAYPDDPRSYDVALRRKARTDPPPPATKSVRGRRLRLPMPQKLGDLSSALKDRRTWRHFGPGPVPLAELSTLLQLTWGVQKWGGVKGQGRVALKTSPSGGARHSIEAYVLALNVEGLKPGVYHYDAATHQLVDLRQRVSGALLSKLLVNQYYYAEAGAAVVMSAVFARAMWRYPFSRAYRTVLTEAGHLGQTFCLAATALGLAPFTVMAFDEHQTERMIRIDGVNESALYVVGVGTRSSRHVKQPGRLPAGEPP